MQTPPHLELYFENFCPGYLRHREEDMCSAGINGAPLRLSRPTDRHAYAVGQWIRASGQDPDSPETKKAEAKCKRLYLRAIDAADPAWLERLRMA